MVCSEISLATISASFEPNDRPGGKAINLICSVVRGRITAERQLMPIVAGTPRFIVGCGTVLRTGLVTDGLRLARLQLCPASFPKSDFPDRRYAVQKQTDQARGGG